MYWFVRALPQYTPIKDIVRINKQGNKLSGELVMLRCHVLRKHYVEFPQLVNITINVSIV